MEQLATEAVAHSADPAALKEDLALYRRQVERVFNRISLTGLPERDPGLSELPLDRVFISLTIQMPRTSLPVQIDLTLKRDQPGPHSKILNRPRIARTERSGGPPTPRLNLSALGRRSAPAVSAAGYRWRSRKWKNDAAALAGGHIRGESGRANRTV